jgi:hypothetical protein
MQISLPLALYRGTPSLEMFMDDDLFFNPSTLYKSGLLSHLKTLPNKLIICSICLFLFHSPLSSPLSLYTPCHHHDGHDMCHTHSHQNSVSDSKQQQYNINTHVYPCPNSESQLHNVPCPLTSQFQPLDANAASITSNWTVGAHTHIYLLLHPGRGVRSQQQTAT